MENNRIGVYLFIEYYRSVQGGLQNEPANWGDYQWVCNSSGAHDAQIRKQSLLLLLNLSFRLQAAIKLPLSIGITVAATCYTVFQVWPHTGKHWMRSHPVQRRPYLDGSIERFERE